MNDQSQTAASTEEALSIPPLRIGSHTLNSRLILGTGRYDSFETMQQSFASSGSDCVTIAVRQEKLHDSSGRNIIDFIDLDRFTLLPNTTTPRPNRVS